MAHCSCPNGHNMWNGNGKPEIWVFRIGYFMNFMERHPDCMLSDSGDYCEIYDCLDEAPEEDLDCWYCDECKSLTVFVKNNRYDFLRMKKLPDVTNTHFDNWEDYVALRNQPFEKFQEYYDGMTPLEALEQYEFDYYYKVSPDREMIYAFNKKNELAFGYQRLRLIEY